jgi:peptidoglycan hydrolase-like protein with peptidoglycan-binding domain
MSISIQRQKLIDKAKSMLGRKEADGSFRPIIDAYNEIRPLPRGYRMRYEDPWCAAFVSAVGKMAGLGDIILAECGCDAMIALYRARGEYHGRDYDAQPGDLIFYNWDGNSSADHVGIIVEKISGGYAVVEGNMSDAVGRRYVPANWLLTMGFATPSYDKASVEPPQTDPDVPHEANPDEQASEGVRALPVLAPGSRGLTVKAMQGILIVRDCACGADGADGVFGGNTEAALRRFQQREKLEVDGICGVRSWEKLLGLR